MQDRATPHRTSNVFVALHEVHGTRVIRLGYPKFANGGMEWPPYSPDLNPVDPRNKKELKKAIRNAVNTIDKVQLRVF